MGPREQQLVGVCGFEVGKVSQSDVGQEINQHIGNNRTLVCECYFCIHHARLSDLSCRGRRSPFMRYTEGLIQDRI